MGQKDNRAHVLISCLLGMFSLSPQDILSAYGYIYQSTDAFPALTLQREMLEASPTVLTAIVEYLNDGQSTSTHYQGTMN